MFGLARKWWVCGLLLLATTINYMDRTTLANAATRVTKEFSLTQEQYGDMEMGFGWAFALGSLVFGLLADRVNVRWLYPIVLLGWSAAGFLSGLVKSYEQLLWCRVILGIFEAGHWPCALVTTFSVLKDSERTMGNSVLQSGASVGAVVTPPLMLWLMTDELGTWRYAFQVVGAVGVAWVVLWFLVMGRTNIAKPETANSGPSLLRSGHFWETFFAAMFVQCVLVHTLLGDKGGSLLSSGRSPISLCAWYCASVCIWLWFLIRAVYRNPDCPVRPGSVFATFITGKFWAVASLILGAQTCWHLFRVWLPKFLIEGRGYDEGAALSFTSVYYIATDVGCILAGVLSLWLVKRGLTSHYSKRRVYLISCLLTSLAAVIPWMPKGWPLLGLILLVGMGALGLFPCYYSFVQELSSQHVGKLTGILSMWVWAVTSPMHKLFGRIIDQTGSFDLGMACAGLAPWIGVLALALLWKVGDRQNAA